MVCFPLKSLATFLGKLHCAIVSITPSPDIRMQANPRQLCDRKLDWLGHSRTVISHSVGGRRLVCRIDEWFHILKAISSTIGTTANSNLSTHWGYSFFCIGAYILHLITKKTTYPNENVYMPEWRIEKWTRGIKLLVSKWIWLIHL